MCVNSTSMQVIMPLVFFGLKDIVNIEFDQVQALYSGLGSDSGLLTKIQVGSLPTSPGNRREINAEAQAIQPQNPRKQPRES